MAVVSGNFDTANWQTGQDVRDVGDKLHELEDLGNLAPVLLTSRLKKAEAHNETIRWWEWEPRAVWTQANGAQAAGATTVIVDDGTLFAVNDRIKNMTSNEVKLVTGVSGTTLTVTAEWGATASATTLDNDYVVNLGPAMLQDANVNTARTIQETEVTNFLQVYSEVLNLTEVAAATEVEAISDLRVRKRKEKLYDVTRSIELSFLFGEKKNDTTGSAPRNGTGGVEGYISTNVTSVNGALTSAKLRSIMAGAFRYGSGEKWMFAGQNVISALEGIMEGHVELSQKATELNIVAQRWVSTFGVLHIVYHKWLENARAGHAYILDMNQIKYRYMRGLDLQLRKNVQPKNAHTLQDEYYAVCGLEFGLQKNHAWIKSVTG